MSDSCIICGKKFSGFMSATHVCESTKNDFLAYKKDVSDICEKCCSSLKDSLKKEISHQKKELLKEIEEIRKNILSEIYVSTTPHEHKWDENIKGIVTGYSIMGTGPLVEMASAFTDLLGKESESYLKKIRIGEENAINMAKLQAAEKGANFISGSNISVSEATKGNGMIIISFVGTAVQIGEVNNSFHKLNELNEKYLSINNLPEIYVAENENGYRAMKGVIG